VLIYRARSSDDFPFHRELERLGRDRGVRIHYLAGPRRRSSSWLPAGFADDVSALAWLAPDVARSDVYVCGPQLWMDAA
jgi:ferredoxin-NADP reductase